MAPYPEPRVWRYNFKDLRFRFFWRDAAQCFRPCDGNQEDLGPMCNEKHNQRKDKTNEINAKLNPRVAALYQEKKKEIEDKEIADFAA